MAGSWDSVLICVALRGSVDSVGVEVAREDGSRAMSPQNVNSKEKKIHPLMSLSNTEKGQGNGTVY